MPKRCDWEPWSEPMLRYHDEEWGLPSHDERHLFEMLILEGAQAGLSWSTILNKREGYREAFAGFDPEPIARFKARDVQRLMNNPAIVRNRLKIEAAIANARATLELGGLDDHLWSFVEGRSIQNRWRTVADLPAETPVSKTMSKDLKKRGFRFVGPTICYAFMQSVGMVNDHVTGCFRYREVAPS